MVKPSGGMRLATDLVHLNRAVKHPIQPFAPVNDILSSLDLKVNFFVMRKQLLIVVMMLRMLTTTIIQKKKVLQASAL